MHQQLGMAPLVCKRVYEYAFGVSVYMLTEIRGHQSDSPRIIYVDFLRQGLFIGLEFAD